MMSYFVGRSFGARMAISSISLLIVFAVSLIACEDEMPLNYAEGEHRNIFEAETLLIDAEVGYRNKIEGFSPDIGSPDTVVTIVGKRFSPKIKENSVRFYNGVEAVILEASPIMLKVVVPEGAETGLITVSSRGISTVSDGVFTVEKSEHDIYLEYLDSICDQLYMVWRDANGDISRIDSNCFSTDQSFPEGNKFCYSPAEDLCGGYRGITGYEISPSCYATYEECIEGGYDSGIYVPDLRSVASLKH